MPTPYFKLSAAGNDFIALLEPDSTPTSEQIRRWCRRGLSVGADGALVLRRDDSTSVEGDTPRVRLNYFNCDGEEAPLCLNGTRCAARLAAEIGWCEDRVVLLTGAGEIEADLITTSSARTTAPTPTSTPAKLKLQLVGPDLEGWLVDVGVPHFVVPVNGDLSTLQQVDVRSVGEQIRTHRHFRPEGTNVDFVTFVDLGRLGVRSYERGVEGETLACGTGILAAVAVGLHLGRVGLPASVETRGGCILSIDGEAEERPVTRWTLTGDARIVAVGHIADNPQPGPLC